MMPFTPALWHSRKLFSINDRKSDQNLIKRRRMIYFILIRIYFNVQLKINYRVIFWNCISGLFLKNIHTMNLAYLDYFCLNLCLIIFALNYLKNGDFKNVICCTFIVSPLYTLSFFMDSINFLVNSICCNLLVSWLFFIFKLSSTWSIKFTSI